MRHGVGHMKYANGDSYNGDWYEGFKTGIGTFSAVGGDKYEGKWFEDRRHGQGKYLFPNKDMVVGLFEFDRFRHGFYKTKNGDKRVMADGPRV